ncbi:hypothetical protein BDD12DRAFT_933859 [Trichophaea hybrida]|nr:hypothetical protein BDD12DRAFT_933859 [Trichophaea hybrida]
MVMSGNSSSPKDIRTPTDTTARLPEFDITPTIEGFTENARAFTPMLSQQLVDRIAQEQYKRFQKLVDNRHKHIEELKVNGRCSNDSDSRDTSPKGRITPAAQFPSGVTTLLFPGSLRNSNVLSASNSKNSTSHQTKHVLEDIQPLTCTFPDCTEPKSFKRQADWARHENERHRHLQWWTYNQPDCTHTC